VGGFVGERASSDQRIGKQRDVLSAVFLARLVLFALEWLSEAETKNELMLRP